MAHLVMISGPTQGQRLPLDRERTLLGRDPDCNVILAADGGRKTGEHVSRKHAVIVADDGKYFVEDGDGKGRPSRNGVLVNGDRVPQPPQRARLHNNAVIKICEFTIIFHEGPGPLPTPAPMVEEPDSSSSIRAAISHESSSVFLAQSAEKLTLLLEIGNRLTHTLQLDTLLPQVVESLLQLFKQADRGFLILVDDTTGDLVPHVIKTRQAGQESQTRFSASIVRECMRTGQGLLSNDVGKQFPTSDSVIGLAIRSVMCAPLCTQEGKTFGVLMLDSQHKKRKFTQDDLNLLMGVTNQGAIALENARFHQDALLRERVSRDLMLAREVVRSFLPAKMPVIPGYEFFASSESAQEVGGDYYDFIALPNQSLAILVGDVAGKGVAASLVMARLSAEARACLRTATNLDAAVRQLNDLMQQLILTDRFVTLAAMFLNPATHTATVANAGHPSPLILRRATGLLEEATPKDNVGPPLGVLDAYPYETLQLTLQPGDNVILFSDGVTEAMDIHGDELGSQSLRAVLEGARGSPLILGQKVLQAVKRHAAGRSQHDDITLVCFGRMG